MIADAQALRVGHALSAVRVHVARHRLKLELSALRCRVKKKTRQVL